MWPGRSKRVRVQWLPCIYTLPIMLCSRWHTIMIDLERFTLCQFDVRAQLAGAGILGSSVHQRLAESSDTHHAKTSTMLNPAGSLVFRAKLASCIK